MMPNTISGSQPLAPVDTAVPSQQMGALNPGREASPTGRQHVATASRPARKKDDRAAIRGLSAAACSQATTQPSEPQQLRQLIDLFIHSPPDLAKLPRLNLGLNQLTYSALGTHMQHSWFMGYNSPAGVVNVMGALAMRLWKPLALEVGTQPMSAVEFQRAINAFTTNTCVPGLKCAHYTWTDHYQGTIIEQQKVSKEVKRLMRIAEGVDPRTRLYSAAEFPPRMRCIMNFAASVALWPFVIPLKVRESESRFGPRFGPCAMLRVASSHLIATHINVFCTPRSFKPSQNLLAAIQLAGLNTKQGLLATMLAVQWEVAKGVKQGPNDRKQALAKAQSTFGFVPQIFYNVHEDDVLSLYMTMLDALVAKDAHGALPPTTHCKVVALVGLSYNCPYLTAMFVLKAAQGTPGANPIAKVVSSIHRPAQRIRKHHSYIQTMLEKPANVAAQELMSARPSSSVPLPGDEDPLEQVHLHAAAEMAQMQPLWPPGMLELLKKRCTLEQLAEILASIACIGSLRVVENRCPVLQAEPQLEPVLRELHKARLLEAPLPYHPGFVNKQHWEEYLLSQPQDVAGGQTGPWLCS